MFQKIKDKIKIRSLNEKVENLNKEIEVLRNQKSIFSKVEIEYLRNLILQDEIINGMQHGIMGFYSEIDMPFLDFITNVRCKLSKMEKENEKEKEVHLLNENEKEVHLLNENEKEVHLLNEN